MEKSPETKGVETPPETSPQPNKKAALVVGLIVGALLFAVGGWYVGAHFQATKQAQDDSIKISNVSQSGDSEQTPEVVVTLPAKTINPKQLIDIYIGKVFPAHSSNNPIYAGYEEGDFHAATTIRQYPMDNFYLQNCTNDPSESYQPACITISYDDLNEKHKALFGSAQNLEKKDYRFNCAELKYQSQEGSSGFFLYNLIPCGMAFSPYIFYQVKDVAITEKGFNINIYYAVVEYDVDDTSEVFDYKKFVTFANGEKHKWTVPEDEENDDKDAAILKDHLSKLPVYQFIFTKDANNYVLSNIIKQ